MPKPDHVLAQPKMVVLGCATTGHVLAQPAEILKKNIYSKNIHNSPPSCPPCMYWLRFGTT